jgi:hypothetical protein
VPSPHSILSFPWERGRGREESQRERESGEGGREGGNAPRGIFNSSERSSPSSLLLRDVIVRYNIINCNDCKIHCKLENTPRSRDPRSENAEAHCRKTCRETREVPSLPRARTRTTDLRHLLRLILRGVVRLRHVGYDSVARSRGRDGLLLRRSHGSTKLRLCGRGLTSCRHDRSLLRCTCISASTRHVRGPTRPRGP